MDELRSPRKIREQPEAAYDELFDEDDILERVMEFIGKKRDVRN